MADDKSAHDVLTKEIDLVDRDPKHLNDDVVKVSLGGGCINPIMTGDSACDSSTCVCCYRST